MAITLAAAQTDLESARTALLAGNYASARSYVAAADIILAGIPQTAAERGAAMSMRITLFSVREAIDAAEASAQKESSRTSRMMTTRTRL